MDQEDILEEILVRLPAKSLLRFRSVCKSWYSLINSSRFIDHHQIIQGAIGNDHIIIKYFNNAENKHVLSYYNDYESLSFLISPTPEEIEIPDYAKANAWGWAPYLAGVVNGIVCITDTSGITLMNPALREFRRLPTLSRRIIGFEFDCLYRVIGLGFGFDESTNDYKVLILDVDFDSNIHYGAIYSLSSNSWRELGKIPMLESYSPSSSNLPYIFFNGSVHWYAPSFDGGIEEDMIITFNMTTESFHEMQPPLDQPEHFQCNAMVFVVDKSLMKFVSVTQETNNGSCFLNVWVMKEYGVEDSWSKEYRIQVISSIGKSLSFWKKDKVFFNTISETELICYDLPTGALHQVRQFDSSGFHVMSIGLVVYNESLVSIN